MLSFIVVIMNGPFEWEQISAECFLLLINTWIESLNTKKTTIDANGNPGLVLHGWDRHTNVVGLSWSTGSQTSPSW
jgi:hypothetical protein